MPLIARRNVDLGNTSINGEYKLVGLLGSNLDRELCVRGCPPKRIIELIGRPVTGMENRQHRVSKVHFGAKFNSRTCPVVDDDPDLRHSNNSGVE